MRSQVLLYSLVRSQIIPLCPNFVFENERNDKLVEKNSRSSQVALRLIGRGMACPGIGETGLVAEVHRLLHLHADLSVLGTVVSAHLWLN